MRPGLRISYPYWCFLLVFTLFLSCIRPAEETSVLPPPTYPLSRPIIGYGVVSDSYTHVVDTPDQRGLSLGYLRQGSVVPVLERRYINNRETAESWVLVDGNYRGWLKEEAIQIYDNEAQAKTAAESMSQ